MCVCAFESEIFFSWCQMFVGVFCLCVRGWKNSKLNSVCSWAWKKKFKKRGQREEMLPNAVDKVLPGEHVCVCVFECVCGALQFIFLFSPPHLLYIHPHTIFCPPWWQLEVAGSGDPALLCVPRGLGGWGQGVAWWSLGGADRYLPPPIGPTLDALNASKKNWKWQSWGALVACIWFPLPF